MNSIKIGNLLVFSTQITISWEIIMEGGHVVRNLCISRTANCGFFGVLGGSVTNFGIESGEISGSCVGGITVIQLVIVRRSLIVIIRRM